jgi:hypothetical protein
MHPEIAKALVTQRREELARSAAGSRPRPSRLFPHWHISWSRMTLPPVGAPAGASAAPDADRATVPGRLGSSLVIIISAYRSA